ncbi:unnamed protein product [Phyllotreta striolata]|uniref:Uncharacterized protein n=1 Tax=Phyllotreta striolata TaxID=444603 RepID=A0A9N9XL78_PHYSR|nr:unnamed protein product [Phyllotreta striolata]
MEKELTKCQCPPLEEQRKHVRKTRAKDRDVEATLREHTQPIPMYKPVEIFCYRAGCCPSCAPVTDLPSPAPCKSLGVDCGGRHDVEITVFPRIDVKEIDACVRCCTCCSGSCSGPCRCTRCLASPPHNKRPFDCGVPCLPIAPRCPVPFGLRCTAGCPSPPCVPPPCPPVCGSPPCTSC